MINGVPQWSYFRTPPIQSGDHSCYDLFSGDVGPLLDLCQTCIWHDLCDFSEKHGNLEQECHSPLNCNSFRSMCAGGIMFIHFQHWTWFDVLQTAFLNQHDATAFVGGMRSFTGRGNPGNRGSLNPRFTCWTLSASPF